MPDLASLSFDIDSSQAQRAIAVLETLKASSITVTAAATQQRQAFTTLGQTYDQQRDQLTRLTQQTSTYDGTLQGLISRLNDMRRVMSDSQTAMNAYASTLVQASSAATALNASVDGLERYIQRARQLGTTTNDLATGFERITAALKNQTVAGNETRLMLQRLGVSVDGLGPNQADTVLQQLVERLRGFRSTQGTTQAFQQVLGPSFDAQALTGLQAQPYQTMRQRELEERATQQRTQIDSQMVQIQRITAELQRNEARREDLLSRYTLQGGVVGRLGLAAGTGAFTSSDDQRAELERIAALPPDQRRQYERYSYQLFRTIDESGPARAIRNFTSGTYSANESEIQVRQQLDTARDGIISAFVNRIGRDLANVVGGYTPMLTQDNRQLTPEEQRLLRSQSAGIMAQYGDTSLQTATAAETRRSDFLSDRTLRQRYTQAFGQGEGGRRYQNQFAQLTQNLLYARAPETAVTDATGREQLIMSLPENQRVRARIGLQLMEQMGLGAQANAIPLGSPLEAITGNVAMSAGQRGAVQGQIEQTIGTGFQQQTEQMTHQIELQRGMRQALEQGRGAAEDYVRVENARLQAIQQNLSATQTAIVLQRTQQVTDEQRLTQATAATKAIEQDNRDQRERLELMKQLNTEGATEIERQRRLLDLTEQQRIRTEQEAGTLPSGDSAAGQAAVERRRAALRDATPAQQALAGARSTLQGTIDDNQRLVDIMRQQGATQEQAAAVLADQKRVEDAILEARRQGNEELAKQLETQKGQTTELNRQAALLQAQIQNLNQATRQQAENDYDRYISTLPLDQRDAARRNRDVYLRNRDAASTPVTVPSSGAPTGDTYGPPAPAVGGQGAWINRPEAAPYLDTINREAAKRGIPPALLAELIGQESGFRNVGNQMGPNGTPISSAGGLGQQIQGNPYLHGGDRFDPRTSIAAAAEEFAARLRNSGGDLASAARGYGVTANLPPAEAQRKLNALQRSIDPNAPLPGETPQQTADRLAVTRQNTDAVRIQQETAETAAQQTFAQRQAIARQRLELLRQGRTGDAARLVEPDLTLPPDLREAAAGRQRADVYAGQAQQATQLSQTTETNIRNLNELADAYHQGKAAVDEVIARQQAHAEALAAGTGVINEEARARQLLNQQLAQARERAAQDVVQTRNQNDVQRAMNRAGPFASPIDLANTRDRELLRQRFRDTPGLEQSAQGQDLLAQERATEQLRDQTQQMQELRDTVKETEGAFMHTFNAVATGAEKPKDALRSLAAELEAIVLKNLIEKPFERMLNQALSSLFGGGDGSSGGGSGDGSGSGGLLGSLGKALTSGGGGDSSGSGGGGRAANDNGGGSPFSHAGGLTGWGIDKIMGEGFFKGGGLIGSLFGGGNSMPGSQSFGDQIAAPGGGIDPTASMSDAQLMDLAAPTASDAAFSGIDAAAARGGVFPRAGLVDYEHQIVDKPTLFHFAKGGKVGLMGEAGAEAIIPLARGADGKLGIQSSGGGGGHTVNFNINTPNADSFRASQSQINARAAAHLNHIQLRNAPA
jgi:hypothetical protein